MVACFARLAHPVTLLLMSLAMANCAKEPVAAPAGPPTTFCKDGDRVCKGNYSATCTGGGTAYALTFCGDKTCQGGECRDTLCPKNQLTCDGQTAVLKCPADGMTSATTSQKCKTSSPAEKCSDGACLPNACHGGDATKKADVKCGDKTLFVCTKGVWVQTACGSVQFCDTATAACINRVCTPTAQQCKDAKVAQVCDDRGAGWVDQVCAATEGCYDGVCRITLASSGNAKDASTGGSQDAAVGEVSDSVAVGTGDTLVKPPKDIDFGIPDVFKVTISAGKTPTAEEKELNLDFPSASYLPVLKALQISGNKDNLLVEIQLGAVEDFQTGTFSTAGGEAGDTKVGMSDGTGRAGGAHPWQAVEYDIEIITFEDAGGRIVGKFSAELLNSSTKKKAYLTNGTFDIKRN